MLILASQFHVMVDDGPRGSGIANLLAIPEAVMLGFLPMDGSVHHQAAMIGTLTLMIMVAWKPLVPGALKVVPAPLVAVVLATGVSSFLGLGIKRVDVPGSMAQALRFPALGDLETLGWGVLASGAALAFIASAETLLCATAVDKLHRGPRAKFDRELAAQGVGNMICGAVGGLPMTGVIVRSSANVEAGATTRASAILHGVWLLVFCVALPFILRMIPTAVLAAVLVFTGYKLVNIAAIRELAKFGRAQLAIYATTVGGIVIVDLLTGVVSGIALSLALIFYQMANLKVDVQSTEGSNRKDLYLEGSATVISLPNLAAALEAMPPDADLHVHLESLDYIDHACMDLMMSWDQQHRALGGTLSIDWDSLHGRVGRRASSVVTEGDTGEDAPGGGDDKKGAATAAA